MDFDETDKKVFSEVKRKDAWKRRWIWWEGNENRFALAHLCGKYYKRSEEIDTLLYDDILSNMFRRYNLFFAICMTFGAFMCGFLINIWCLHCINQCLEKRRHL